MQGPGSDVRAIFLWGRGYPQVLLYPRVIEGKGRYENDPTPSGNGAPG
jgi:hypothetical protein